MNTKPRRYWSHYIGSLRCSFDVYRQLLGTESIHPGPNIQHCASGKVRKKCSGIFTSRRPHRVSSGRITQSELVCTCSTQGQSRTNYTIRIGLYLFHTESVQDGLHNQNWSVLVPHRVSPGRITQPELVCTCSTHGQSRTNYTIRIGLYLFHTGSVQDELHNQNWSVLVPHRVSPGRITQSELVCTCSTQGHFRTNYIIRIGLYLFHTGSLQDELHNQNWSVLVPHRITSGRITQSELVCTCSTHGQSRTNYTIRTGLYLFRT